MTEKEIISILQTIGEVCINYSEITKKYYVTMKNFSYIANYRWYSTMGILEHKDTPYEAIRAFYAEIIDCDEVVMNVNSLDRYETAKNIKVYKFEEGEFINITDNIKYKDRIYKYFEGWK